MIYIPVAIYVLCSAILILYGLHHYFIMWLFFKVKDKVVTENNEVEAQFEFDAESAPAVLSQIPLYNESTVAERVIRAVAKMDYPNHFIQLLDDSNDETVEMVDAIAAELKAEGVNIEVVRRDDRVGFKAGALAYGMTLNDSPYIAIFDSDFVPPTNFLQRIVPHFLTRKKCGVVQARWDHLNADDSYFTSAQSVGVNGHFIVEQTARSYNDYFLNFNGTAGVWNREAIDDAGGWNADTLTEDLDLSYRAQLRGWKFHFLPGLPVPAELPALYRGFRSQQFRWAKGSMQTAKKILPLVWKSDEPLRKKIEATFHLTHYSIHLCMLIQLVLALPIALATPHLFQSVFALWFLAPMALAMMGPSLLYLCAELWISPGRAWHFFTRLPMLLLIGFGICASNARACIEGLIGIESPFVRTPKQGDNKGKIRYKGKKSVLPWIEVALSLLAVATAAMYLISGVGGMTSFFLIYAAGLGLFGVCSLIEGR